MAKKPDPPDQSAGWRRFRNITRDTAAGTAKDMGGGVLNMIDHMERFQPPNPQTPTADDALRKAASQNDTATVKSMAGVKPLRSYAGGTDYVPETGPAMLHEGEAVIPKETAEMIRKPDRVSSALGGKKKKKKKSKKSKGSGKKPHTMHIRRAANGGYIATHDFKGDAGSPAPESEDHALGSIDELKDHVADNMGDQQDPAAGAEPTEQPPPRGGM